MVIESNLDQTTKFLYFAYGSNLLEDRIRIQNPSAVRKTIGVLKGYRLDFFHQPHRQRSIWNGSAATIIEDCETEVWGTVWEIDFSQMVELDRQEGVHVNFYIPLIKEIHTVEGEIIECRLYQMCGTPTDIINLSDPDIPLVRKPSKTYLETIIRGAEESELPEKYLYFLRKIVHNDCTAHPDMLRKLNLLTA